MIASLSVDLNVVLADAGGTVVMAIVLAVSVISWIVNLIQGANLKDGNPKNRQRPANEEKSELERFLQEITGNKPPEPEKPRPAPKPAQPKPAQAANRGKKPNKGKPQNQPAPRSQKNERPGARLAQSHLAPMAGEGIRAAMTSPLEPRKIDSAVNKDVSAAVRRDIGDAVSRDIGADGTITAQRSTAHPLIQALRNPQGVRQAIILSEILSRPKSVR